MSDPENVEPPRVAPPPLGLAGVFEDLEQQAAGLHLSERDAELADRARGEYATVSFASRVHASLGLGVTLTLRDGQLVEGALAEAGSDWCVVTGTDGRAAWLVRLEAVVAAYGLSARAVPEAARPAVARLGFGSALRRLAEEYAAVVVHLATGGSLPVRVLRVGADFLEAEAGGRAHRGSSALVVPFRAVLSVRTG